MCKMFTTFKTQLLFQPSPYHARPVTGALLPIAISIKQVSDNLIILSQPTRNSWTSETRECEGERCRVARFARYPLTSYYLESIGLKESFSLFVHRKDMNLCHADKIPHLLIYWNFGRDWFVPIISPLSEDERIVKIYFWKFVFYCKW